MDPKAKFNDLPPEKRGFYLRTVDDGDPHVYIRTDWLSIVALSALLIAVGALLF